MSAEVLAHNGRIQGRKRRSLNGAWIRANWFTLFSGLILLAFLIGAAWPTSMLPYDPLASSLSSRFSPPFQVDRSGNYHILGADFLGRDMLSRILYSGRYSLMTAIGASMLVTVFGTLIGVLCGYVGGWIDSLTMRIVDALLALPVILIAIVLATIIGRSILTLTIILALTGWADFTRVVRAETLAISSQPYVESSRAIGATTFRIVLRTLIPNAMAVVIVMTTYSVGRFILLESSISYLGMGVVPPASSWGVMVGEGRDYIFDAPFISVIPGLVITIVVIATNFVGDGLRDILDPRSRAR
ncbi:MAG: ABC transporter permease [Thermomicrobiales bacterium]|nr:ABC transporter permease [Thermomicrobiales bacterium]